MADRTHRPEPRTREQRRAWRPPATHSELDERPRLRVSGGSCGDHRHDRADGSSGYTRAFGLCQLPPRVTAPAGATRPLILSRRDVAAPNTKPPTCAM